MNTSFGQYEDITQVMNFLYSVKRSKRNYSLLTECFLGVFTKYPQSFPSIISHIQSELQNPLNTKAGHLAHLYVQVFSLLCERFGFYEHKNVLDDLCFLILEPKAYTNLQKKLLKYQEVSVQILSRIEEKIQSQLQKYDIDCSISGRYKHLYSIHKKCKLRSIETALELDDIFAFRIIVRGDKNDCFRVIHILHDHFSPRVKRYKDYISIPKINGYQSLHTSIKNIIPEINIPIEIQVRTENMDEVAERGVAAHFLYARDKSANILSNKEQKLVSHLEAIQEQKQDRSSIYSLSPDGDIYQLKAGSKAGDFADKIHSKLRKRAKGVVVNGISQNMKYTLQDFDTIEILT